MTGPDFNEFGPVPCFVYIRHWLWGVSHTAGRLKSMDASCAMKLPALGLLPGTMLASTYFLPRCGPLQDGPPGPYHPGQIFWECSRFSHLLKRNKTWDTSPSGSSISTTTSTQPASTTKSLSTGNLHRRRMPSYRRHTQPRCQLGMGTPGNNRSLPATSRTRTSTCHGGTRWWPRCLLRHQTNLANNPHPTMPSPCPTRRAQTSHLPTTHRCRQNTLQTSPRPHTHNHN